MVKAAVVILNYNGAELLKQFLPSVIQHTPSWCRIIVADNASTDQSLEVLQVAFPHIERIELKQNKGFAGGYNQALKQVNAEYYILLNSDIEVTGNWVDPVINFLDQNAQVAACQPKIKSYHHKEYFEHAGGAGGYIDFLGYPFCRGRIFEQTEKDTHQYDDIAEVFWASGAAMFIRSKVFHQMDGFDETFFAHMEEIDMCWRIKRSGHQIFYIPQSVVYHVGGGTLHKSNPRKTYLNFRNNLIMLFKNLQSDSIKQVFFVRLFLDKLAALRFLFSGQPKDAWAVVKAYAFIISHFGRLKQQRKKSVMPFVKVFGIYHRSIVAEHFLRMKKYYFDLNPDYFKDT